MCFWPAARALRHAQGYDKAGLPGTAIGPLGHAETWCKGIDDLEKRCAEAYAAGARFAKWRNVLQIDPANGLPSDLAIEMCVQNLAQVRAFMSPRETVEKGGGATRRAWDAPVAPCERASRPPLTRFAAPFLTLLCGSAAF